MTAVVNIDEPPATRSGGKEVYPFRLIIQCYSRSTGNTYDALKVASEMYDTLKNSRFPVYDSDGNAIGVVQIREGRLSNESGKFGETDKDVQMRMIVFEGRVDECSC